MCLHIMYDFLSQMENNPQFVNCYDRDRMVKWLCVLSHDFHYCLEVFFRATAILDSFLSVMRVSEGRTLHTASSNSLVITPILMRTSQFLTQT